MATPKFNSKSPTIKRILREASELSIHPSPDYHAAPAADSNLFDWHFTLRGPPSSPFSSGMYHGRIVLPPTYPLRPPSFRFLTPSGRFEVNREICLSISGHHEETWQPAWGIRTALVALRSFMETDAKGQLGGMEAGEKMRIEYAGRSQAWKCPVCGKSNGEIMEDVEKEVREKEKDGGKGMKEELEVPMGLRLGFKDEMGGQGGESSGSGKEGEKAESSSQERTEYPAARPAQSVPKPTGTVQTTPAVVVQRPQAVVQRRSNDGVPAWIDRSIAVVFACLVFMILKVWLGY